MLKPTNNDSKFDKKEDMVKKNPCGICRALGLPICRGHGGGGSESENEDEVDNDLSGIDTPSLELQPSKAQLHLLESLMENATLWQESLDEDLQYQFNNIFSLLSIRLDLAKGMLTCSGKEPLTKEEQAELDALYRLIQHAFEEYKNELGAHGIELKATFQRQGNQLNIQIQPQQHFDAFIIRLMENNLLPTTQIKAPAPAAAVNDKAVHEKSEDLIVPGYKSPSPFDIARGPKPIDTY